MQSPLIKFRTLINRLIKNIIKQKQNIRTKTNRGKTLKRFESHKIFVYNDLFWKKVGAF